MHVLGDYKRQRVTLDQRRLRRPRLGRFHASTAPYFREHLIVPHIVAVVEEFSRARLMKISEQTASLGPPMLQNLWEEVLESVEGSWEKQFHVWAAWHQVDLRSAPGFESFRGFIEARNAILHGLGELTEKQLRKKAGVPTKNFLRQAGIATDGRRLVLPGDAVEKCARVSRGVVVWLDQEAP